MMPKLMWVVAAAVLGIVCLDFSRSLRKRRRRAEVAEELARWEGDGGNVVDARS
jgi:hypothetical protein